LARGLPGPFGVFSPSGCYRGPCSGAGAFNISIFGLQERRLSDPPAVRGTGLRPIRPGLRLSNIDRVLRTKGWCSQRSLLPVLGEEKKSILHSACIDRSYTYRDVIEHHDLDTFRPFKTPRIPTTVTRLPVFGSSNRSPTFLRIYFS